MAFFACNTEERAWGADIKKGLPMGTGRQSLARKAKTILLLRGWDIVRGKGNRGGS